MREIICKVCKKKIEGYNLDHADSLLQQHMIYCDKKAKRAEEDAKNKQVGGKLNGR